MGRLVIWWRHEWFGNQLGRDVTFYYRGKDTQEGDYDSWTSNYGTCSYSQGTTGAPRQAPEGQAYGWTGDQPDEIMAHVVPKGIGASSGYSAGNGAEGRSEGIFADVTPYNTMGRCELAAGGGGGGGSEIVYECGRNFSYGFDFVFGGSAVGCVCYCYYPGSFSQSATIKAAGTAFSCCNFFPSIIGGQNGG